MNYHITTNHKSLPLIVILPSLLLMLLAAPIQADIPQLINYQGKLVGTSGCVDGSVDLEVGFMMARWWPHLKGQSLYIRPMFAVGGDRPVDGSVEVGYKIVGW